MSEISPEELVKTVHINIRKNQKTVSHTVRRASVIPTPIDPTLSIEGEAADAKATGVAIAGVADSLRVNEKAPVTSGGLKKITVYANEIAMSDDPGAQNIAQAIESVADRTANDIYYDVENLVTVKAAIDGIKTDIDTELTEEEIDDIFDEVFGGDE